MKKSNSPIRTFTIKVCSCLIILALFYSSSVFTQSLSWAKNFGGSTIDSGRSIYVDIDGFIYTTGIFEGAANFDPSTEEFILTASNLKGTFIMKQDSQGNVLWVKGISGSEDVQGSSIMSNMFNEVIVVGNFRGTVDFDPSDNVYSLTSTTEAMQDAFIMKLDNEGSFMWAKNYGGSSGDMAESVDIDFSGNIFTVGFYSYLADLDPGEDVVEFTSSGLYSNYYIQKLDTDGNYLWAHGFGGNSADHAYTVKVDIEGNSHISGNFYGQTDFDPGPEEFNLTPNENMDVFVQKLDPDGNFIWAKNIGLNYSNYLTSMDIDDLGNTYIAGIFNNIVDFDPDDEILTSSPEGAYDIFVLKLNVMGTLEWVNSIGGIGWEELTALDVDSQGNVFISGSFGETVDFNPGPSVSSLTAVFEQDHFLCKWDSEGNYQWVKQFSGSSYVRTNEIETDSLGNIFLTGSFFGTPDFDPGSGTLNITSYGDVDAFILKFGNCTKPNASFQIVSECFEYTWINGVTYYESTNSQTHVLSGISANGCDSVIVLDLTIPTIDSTLSLSGNTITANFPDGVYQWFDCSEEFMPISGQTSQNFTASSNGIYAVEITLGDCSVISDCIEIDTFIEVGLNEWNSNLKLTLYPNPNEGIFTINFPNNLSEINTTIYDSLGRMVYHNKLTHLDPQIDLINFPKGVYSIQFTNESKQLLKTSTFILN